MIAPGVRVARGPNWIWNDQGMHTCVYEPSIKQNTLIASNINLNTTEKHLTRIKKKLIILSFR